MDKDFESYLCDAMGQLPEEFKNKLNNVDIFIEDYPSQNQINKFAKSKKDYLLLGLYEGIPQNRRGNYGVGGAVPDKITIFRYPILSLARSREHLIKLIKDTLFHEIGHHFGMSERQIREAQKKNKLRRI